MVRQLASCIVAGFCGSLLGCGGGKTADADKGAPIAMTVREKSTEKSPAKTAVGGLEGTVKTVDADKRSLTVTVRGQDQTFVVDPNAFVTDPTSFSIPGGLRGLRPGYEVTLVMSKSGGQESVSLITVRWPIFKLRPIDNQEP